MENKVIYVAGGCFWGVEHYFKQVRGIIDTEVGYANYNTVDNISYEVVCSGNYDAVECVKLTYDNNVITLNTIIDLLFLIIDPTIKNRQGNDRGVQYRTGIYYTNNHEGLQISDYINTITPKYKDWYFEVKPLSIYTDAETYHQDYLEVNQNGYCHVNMSVLPDEYRK